MVTLTARRHPDPLQSSVCITHDVNGIAGTGSIDDLLQGACLRDIRYNVGWICSQSAASVKRRFLVCALEQELIEIGPAVAIPIIIGVKLPMLIQASCLLPSVRQAIAIGVHFRPLPRVGHVTWLVKDPAGSITYSGNDPGIHGIQARSVGADIGQNAVDHMGCGKDINILDRPCRSRSQSVPGILILDIALFWTKWVVVVISVAIKEIF